MKAAIRVAGLIVGVGVLCALTGCVTPPPQDPYVPTDRPGVTTAGLDPQDYQLAANNIVQKILKREVPKGYVVTLGPVDTKRTPFDVDVEKLQDKMEVLLDDEGTLRFTALKKALTEGKVPFDEIEKLTAYNWENANPIDREWLEKFGKRAKINGILFGRVSSIQRSLPWGGTEVTYTFVWRLANTETGVNDMALEYEIRKNVR